MSKRVAIVGAAGAVGQELLRLLAARNFPVAELRLLATARSAGQVVEYAGTKIKIEEVGPDSFKGIDFVFFAATGAASKALAPEVARAGGIAIDKSSTFRMDPKVPLVVPEINADDLKWHQGIIASPNCSTTQLVMALKPLHEVSPLRRVVVTSFQSVSGTGRDAMDELEAGSRAFLAGEAFTPQIYPHPIAFNCLPHIDSFDGVGYTGEEMKLTNESRKILGLPDLRLAATTVRVPVFISHAESVLVETERRISPAEAREALARFPGVVVQDDPAHNVYPTQLDAAGRDEVFVGRIREDISSETGLHMWVVSDNLRKGAATNAIQIAEKLMEMGLR
jgi:aspartate-semialdehyde dehydrogenase